MSLRKAAEMALDALEYVSYTQASEVYAAIEALRAALIEPDEYTVECNGKKSSVLTAMMNSRTKREAALAEADEPVAWRVRASGATGAPGPWRIYQQSAKPGVNHPECCDFVPLFSHPPRREPLTEEQIRNHLATAKSHEQTWLMFARAIERAHGIGGDE